MSSVLKSSAYDRDFEQKCFDHGIYMPSEEEEPGNMQEAQERLTSRRPSLSPSRFSQGAFKRFRKGEATARDEGDVISVSLPIILGEKRCDHVSAGNVLFGNMNDMAPDVFKKPKPDLYWGAQPSQIDRPVRQYLSHQITPSTKDSYPAAPNFFLEAKGPDGSSAVKTRQACYVGALGARAMQALRCYGQAEPTYDSKAYTFSTTYQDGTLKIYSHHPTQPRHPDKPAEYHMFQLGGWDLTGSSQMFCEGVGAFRNARDLATEQRNQLIDQINAVARTQLADNMSFDKSNSQNTMSLGRMLATSANKLGCDHPAKSRAKRRTNRRTKHQKKGGGTTKAFDAGTATLDA